MKTGNEQLQKISVQTVKREHLNRGRVRAFKKNHGKRSKKHGTLCPKRSLAKNGRVWYGMVRYDTALYGKVDKFITPTELTFHTNSAKISVKAIIKFSKGNYHKFF